MDKLETLDCLKGWTVPLLRRTHLFMSLLSAAVLPAMPGGLGKGPHVLHPILTLPVEGLGDSLASTWAPFWCLGMDSWYQPFR